jgi:hypothetical protein
MKKITILVLLFLLTLTLTSCVNEKQEQLAVYSFYGKNENFIISNGTIVLSNSEDIFWGGNLQAAQSESISDISSYKATFYTMVDGKQEIILVDEFQNLSTSELLGVDLGKKFSNDSAISKQFMEIEKSNGKLYCELKITDREGNKNSYTIELELTKVTK